MRRRFMRLALTGAFLLPCLLFGLSRTAAAQSDIGMLRGSVTFRSTDKAGKVTDEPAPNVLIRIYGPGSYSSFVTKTARDGAFYVRLRAGEWRIYAVATGYVADGVRRVFVPSDKTTVLYPPIVLTKAKTASGADAGKSAGR
jgi:hypothetical protein